MAARGEAAKELIQPSSEIQKSRFFTPNKTRFCQFTVTISIVRNSGKKIAISKHDFCRTGPYRIPDPCRLPLGESYNYPSKLGQSFLQKCGDPQLLDAILPQQRMLVSWEELLKVLIEIFEQLMLLTKDCVQLVLHYS
jgi:hypothetical protein